MEFLSVAAGVILALVLVPATIELGVLTVAGLWPARRRPAPAPRPGFRLCVLVPAHNEAPWIARTVRSLLESRSRSGATCEIVVIADNCEDATAAIAAGLGARVIVRENTIARGKGFALQHAIAALKDDRFDGFAVVDADTVVDENFVRVVSGLLSSGVHAVQCRYLVLNRMDSVRTGLLSGAFLAFNGLRPRGRSRLGLSSGLFGNGFALSAATVGRVPYEAGSIVEDLEYHMALVRAGLRVDFTEETAVRAQMPSGGPGAKTQRARWEGGRLRMLREHGAKLAGDALRGRWRSIEPLLDLLVPPLGYFVLLALAAMAVPSAPIRALGAVAFAMAIAHSVAGLIIGRARAFEWASLAFAPAYVLSKLPLIRNVVQASRRSARWVRTDRLGGHQVAVPSPGATEAPPTLSVIVVSFNTRDILERCLRAVEAECRDVPHELIVVDNASSDGSADMVARAFPGATVIRNESNIGFGAANNAAARRARGRYVVLVNPDAFVQPGSLRSCLALMEGHPTIGISGARLVGTDGRPHPSARAFPSVLNDMLILTGASNRHPLSRVLGRPERTWADPASPASVDWVVGAFMFIRRNALEAVGGFDERFFMYYEEVDLCRRVKEAGFSVFYWPDAVVIHAGGVSVKSLEKRGVIACGQMVRWRLRSRLLYYRKHHGAVLCWLAWATERAWHRLRAIKNGWSERSAARAKHDEAIAFLALSENSWIDTDGGRRSPPSPW